MSAVRARRPPRRRRWPWVAAVVIGLVVAFAAGIGLGEALNDNPDTGGTETLVRTLHPLPLVPLARDTVTVTVTRP